MGVKLLITKEDLPFKFQKYNLVKSKDGVSQSVYFLSDKFVLKIFENTSEDTIQNELTLLSLLSKLPVAKSYKTIYYIKDKPCLIYKKAKGLSLKISDRSAIKQIGIFLSKMHKITYAHRLNNTQYFTTKNIRDTIVKANNKIFLDSFDTLDLQLATNGIIHGDLFMDNCTFYKNKLECVFDFTGASQGDFIFDLAVVAISWCKSIDDITILFEAYGYNSSIKDFIPYMKYAYFYYASIRIIDNRMYNDLFYCI